MRVFREPVLLALLACCYSVSVIAEDCLAGNSDTIPALHWEKRSDWLDVTTDISPPARGDGISDDTRSIQRAIDMLGPRPGDTKVVYLPAGNYRISATLKASNMAGVMLVGHGRDTVIEWHGEKHGIMFHSNGLHRAIYRGISWDGKQTAAVGIDHRSEKRYETHILHEYSQFSHFLEAGIRVGHKQKKASAEIYYRQLKFDNNQHGIELLSWNDYNNVIDGAHFVNNEIGIAAYKGNFNVRNSRFENSKKSDLLISAHAYSARRVVSSNSKRLLRTMPGKVYSNFIGEDLYVQQDMQNEASIEYSLRGPLLLFDSQFSSPSMTPPVNFTNRRILQRAVFANLKTTDASLYSGHRNSHASILPRQKNEVLVHNDSRFLLENVSTGSLVLDVKQHCGADGDGKSNDTHAITNCLEQAPEGAVIYIPSGVYRISQTISLPDKNLTIQGAGFHSVLQWAGSAGGVLVEVDIPGNSTITDIALNGDDKTTKLRWSGNRPGKLLVHNVFGWYSDTNSKNAFVLRGQHARAKFHATFINGNTVIEQFGASKILLGFSISPSLTISGEQAAAAAAGVLSRASCCNDYTLQASGSASIVITDWYNEQSRHLLLAGNDGNNQPGRLVVDMKKAESESDIAMTFADYNGDVIFTGGFFGNWNADSPLTASITDGENTRLYMLATMFRHHVPELCKSGGACYMLGSIVENGDPFADVPDNDLKGSVDVLNAGLDSFRRLGKLDLALNYCELD